MEELSVITVTYEVYKKLIELNTTIDKKYRHTLSEPVVANCSDTIKHAPKPLKASYLVQADAMAEVTAMNIRALLELNTSNETNILKIQAKLSEARRMIGGWRKSTV